MFGILITVYVIICVLIIVSILMQSGREGGMGASFGSSYSGDSVFGGKGATQFLTKVTVVGGILFAVLAVAISVYLTYGKRESAPSSVIKERATQQQQAPSAAPGAEEQVRPDMSQPSMPTPQEAEPTPTPEGE